MSAPCRRPRTICVRFQSVTTLNPANVRASVASCPCFVRSIANHYPLMPAFDPNDVRKAVAEFTPCHQQKFEHLLPAKDVISELRQKRASFRAIAELLTQHCLPTGKTAIAAFCHEVLGENTRPHRRLPRKRLPAIEPPTETKIVLPAPATAEPGEPATPKTFTDSSRGPRIAQIRKLIPQNHEKTDPHP